MSILSFFSRRLRRTQKAFVPKIALLPEADNLVIEVQVIEEGALGTYRAVVMDPTGKVLHATAPRSIERPDQSPPDGHDDCYFLDNGHELRHQIRVEAWDWVVKTYSREDAAVKG